MKTSIRFFMLAILFLSITQLVPAQWTQTEGQFQKVSFLAADGATLFAGTNQGLFVSPNEGNAWIRIDPSLVDAFPLILPIFTGNPFSDLPLDSILIAVENSSLSFSVEEFLMGIEYYSYILQNITASGTELLDTLKFSFDCGQTWVSFENLPVGISIYSIAVHHSDIYIGTNQGVFRINPDRFTWDSMNSGLTNTVVHSILILNDVIIAGTEGGIFYISPYAMNPFTWIPFNDGLTNTKVMALARNGMYSLYAGTDGGGIFAYMFIVNSDFWGWQAVNSGLMDLSITSLAANDQYLFAGTRSSGVWKRTHDDMLTSVSSSANSIPNQFRLDQNYPNPFNPSTTIEFTLAENGMTTLKIFDILGREVATLVNEELKTGVLHKINFNAANLSSGMYYYRLETRPTNGSKSGTQTLVRKLLLIK